MVAHPRGPGTQFGPGRAGWDVPGSRTSGLGRAWVEEARHSPFPVPELGQSHPTDQLTCKVFPTGVCATGNEAPSIGRR